MIYIWRLDFNRGYYLLKFYVLLLVTRLLVTRYSKLTLIFSLKLLMLRFNRTF